MGRFGNRGFILLALLFLFILASCTSDQYIPKNLVGKAVTPLDHTYVERFFSVNPVENGTEVTVTLQVYNIDGDSIYVVEEDFPNNFVITANPDNGATDEAGKIKYAYYDQTQTGTPLPDMALTYTLRAPQAQDNFTFDGIYQMEYTPNGLAEPIQAEFPDLEVLFPATGPVCGDGNIDAPDEACDDAGNNGIACSPPYGGSCNYCNSTCGVETVQGAVCGDGNVDTPNEECDGANLNGQTCTSIGSYAGGILSCASCSFDTSSCTSFGTLHTSFVTPAADSNVTKDQLFTVQTQVTCVGGDCGTVTATLDPYDCGAACSGGTQGCTDRSLGPDGCTIAHACDGTNIIDDIHIDTVSGQDAVGGEQLTISVDYGCWGDAGPQSSDSVTIWYHDSQDWSLLQYWDRSSLTGCDSTPGDTDGTIQTTFTVPDVAGTHTIRVIEADQDAEWDQETSACPTPTNPSANYGDFDDVQLFVTSSTGGQTKGTVSTVPGTTPFYTIDANPQSCGSLSAGESCTTTWQVNATGTEDTTYEFFTIYSSSHDPDVTTNNTEIRLLTIAAPAQCVIDADCDDSNACNGLETCNTGTCQAGTPLVADDGVSCTVDSCDPGTGVITNTPDNNLCNDGLYCTETDTCHPTNGCEYVARDCSGNDVGAVNSCTNNPDSNPLTRDVASAVTSVCEEAGAGSCTSPAQSFTHSCDLTCGATCETNGDCADTCNGDLYLTGGTCDGSSCACSYGNTQDCNSLDGWYSTGSTRWVTNSDQCTESQEQEEAYRDYTCAVGGCTYSITNTRWTDTGADQNRPNGISCDDSSVCTTTDVCTAGVCGGTTISCDDGYSCTADSCDDVSGCMNTPNNNACGLNEVCSPTNFPATSDGCGDIVTDCTGLPDNTICTDGTFCNGDEVCQSEVCVAVVGDRDCSAQDQSAINTCTNDPDGVPNSRDTAPFTPGVCNGNTDACEQGTQTLSHSCDTTCSATACEVNADCDDGDAGTNDLCNTLSCGCLNILSCTDTDGDTYNIEGDSCGPIDCRPNDDQSYPGATEVCDGFDNDCDGNTDEDISNNPLTQSCYTGPGGTENIGLCQAGTQTCSSGSYGTCTGQVLPATEVCDGLDNDCDNNVDEDFVCGSSFSIILDQPAGNYVTNNGEVTFSCSATSLNEMTNISLYLYRNDGSTITSEKLITETVSGTSASLTPFLQTDLLDDYTYTWNCEVCDTIGNCEYAVADRSFTSEPIYIALQAPQQTSPAIVDDNVGVDVEIVVVDQLTANVTRTITVDVDPWTNIQTPYVREDGIAVPATYIAPSSISWPSEIQRTTSLIGFTVPSPTSTLIGEAYIERPTYTAYQQNFTLTTTNDVSNVIVERTVPVGHAQWVVWDYTNIIQVPPENISVVGTTLTFTLDSLVSGDTRFTIGGVNYVSNSTAIDIWDDSSTRKIYINQNFNVYANYTNQTSNESISGATCTLTLDEQQYSMTETTNGTYVSPSLNNSVYGNYMYGVLCEHPDFDTLATSAIIQINPLCGDAVCQGSFGETCSTCAADCGSCENDGGSPLFLKGSPLLLKGSAPPPPTNTYETVYEFNEEIYEIETVYDSTRERELLLEETDSEHPEELADAFYHTYTVTPDMTTTEATIKFKVEKQWIDDLLADEDTVTLFHYLDSWEDRGTSQVDEDTRYYYYEASVDELGIFLSIGADFIQLSSGTDDEEIEVQSEETTNQFLESPMPELVEDDANGLKFLFALVTALLFVSAIFSFFYGRAHLKVVHEKASQYQERYEELKSYIAKARAKGKSDIEIKQSLTSVGWKSDIVDGFMEQK